MYPNMNKSEMPSAPPTYLESVGSAPIGFTTPMYPSPSVPPMYQPVPPSYPTSNTNQPNQVVIVQQNPPLARTPVQMICPACKSQIISTIQEDTTPSAYLCCALTYFTSCCLCSCLPFCMDAFKMVHHTCPQCKTFLGTYKP
ncbi:lipopolysaccharide-induced tumor necrosis factor-alpha factor homolog [Daktulosphaira vitifoliae]|uniref:lipopolysaccharide-induced tumor necrosis factor-alpha factor homolog n=1 Tax=Daktulosphaira vitifoliae TaxID=58002 RepID=UPI0021AAF08C|nr:lipopolysaccharide-induced tumor necrosis factor-alpha factor homolog [Daktulosphaira vitifoliae]